MIPISRVKKPVPTYQTDPVLAPQLTRGLTLSCVRIQSGFTFQAPPSWPQWEHLTPWVKRGPWSRGPEEHCLTCRRRSQPRCQPKPRKRKSAWGA